MGLGHSLRDAESLAKAIVIEWLVVYTLMGYRFPTDKTERYYGIPFTNGIHAGRRRFLSGEDTDVRVDARKRTPPFLGKRTPIPP